MKHLLHTAHAKLSRYQFIHKSDSSVASVDVYASTKEAARAKFKAPQGHFRRDFECRLAVPESQL